MIFSDKVVGVTDANEDFLHFSDIDNPLSDNDTIESTATTEVKQETLPGSSFIEDSKYHTLDFRSPADLHAFCYSELMLADNPVVHFHPWQVWTSDIVAKDYTREAPLMLLIVACNSSGKDKFVIAPVACWLAVSKIKHQVILTSASGLQLSAQTERNVREECARINAKLGTDIFDIKQRHIKCNISGSEIIFFATDEEGKAEGFHPDPGHEMTIIVNESKSVAEGIFRALTRCEGYTRWIEVSSPGVDAGHLFNVANSSKNYPEVLVPGEWYLRKITAFDCPHISKHHISRVASEYGVESDFYRSSILAEFTSFGQQVLITWDNVRSCQKSIKEKVGIKRFGEKFAGLDLAAGGDECVLSIWHGNTCIALECWRVKDTTKTRDHCLFLFQKYGLKPENIYGDDGGVGRGIIDQLAERGWQINRVLNQSPSLINKLEFSNRGMEVWWKFSRLVQLGVINIPNDALLQVQLTTRLYKKAETLGKMALLSKREMRAAGRKSPDRADATVLAFTGKDIREFAEACGVKITGTDGPAIEEESGVAEDLVPPGYIKDPLTGIIIPVDAEKLSESVIRRYSLPTMSQLLDYTSSARNRENAGSSMSSQRYYGGSPLRNILDDYYEGVL